jgi:hypothetical protein
MSRYEIFKTRFETKFEAITESGCWIWTGSDDGRFGYGVVKLNGKNTKAHRAAWLVYCGTIPTGMCVLHRCDTPLCVNPHHLFLGTKLDNNLDKIKKKRNGPPNNKGEHAGGVKLSNANVISIRSDKRQLKEIAKEYGVCFQSISLIKLRKTWTHI